MPGVFRVPILNMQGIIERERNIRSAQICPVVGAVLNNLNSWLGIGWAGGDGCWREGGDGCRIKLTIWKFHRSHSMIAWWTGAVGRHSDCDHDRRRWAGAGCRIK